MKRKNPRHGSMQFWPRKRASRHYARIRSWASVSEAKPLAIVGYKAGMTNVMATDVSPHSITKNETISIPATVIECPPLKISGIRIYKPKGYGFEISKDYFFKTDKFFQLKTHKSKTISTSDELTKITLSDGDYMRVLVYTQPNLTSVGKKRPEIFEIAIGGTFNDQITFIKDHLESGISASESFLKEGSFADSRAVTKGKGFQGPVKRFGVSIRSHKSEKTIRGPGSLGGWKSQMHTMYRIAHAGQMGFHQRMQYNNQILKISSDSEIVNPQGGFLNYGLVKNDYVLVKGSIPGPKKRLIFLTAPIRPFPKNKSLPKIKSISKASQQGN